MEMEELELADAQTKALLKSKTPLADVCKAWNKTETHHMPYRSYPTSSMGQSPCWCMTTALHPGGVEGAKHRIFEG